MLFVVVGIHLISAWWGLSIFISTLITLAVCSLAQAFKEDLKAWESHYRSL